MFDKYYKKLFNTILILLIFFIILWVANIYLKSKDINMLEKKEVKRVKVRRHRNVTQR